MVWWMYAFIAAAVWGVHYVLLERAMTVASPITVYLIPTAVSAFAIPFFYKTLAEDYKTIITASYDVKVSLAAIMFTGAVASLCLYKAINMSNATLASLIEIAYPIFVAIFAYLIFGHNHLTHWTTVVGGLFILAGAVLVVSNS